jgi:putative ABC transport system permease protein
MRGRRLGTLSSYTAREMRRHSGRTLLTLLGIVLGVAAVVAISVTAATTHRAYADMFGALAGRAALEVVSDGLGGFQAELVPQLGAAPSVRTAVPVVQTPTALLGEAGAVPVLVLGVDPQLDRVARDYTLREGKFLDAEEGVLLSAEFARSNGCRVGEPVRLLTPLLGPTGPRIARLPVLGLLEPYGAAAFNGGAVIFMPLAIAQRLYDLAGRVTSVQLVLREGTNREAALAEVRGRLPPGLTVRTPEARVELAEDALYSAEIGLGTLSVVSLVAGAFVILNSFLMTLGERRRQLAILRALGATRGQVTRLLLREALLLGGVGTALGIAAGVGLSVGLRQIMEQLLGVALPAPSFTPGPFVAALMLGPGMALAATYFPARRAGRRAVLEDLLHRRGVQHERHSRLPGYLGLALLVPLVLLEVGLVRDWFSPHLIPVILAPGVALGLIGAVLALPLALGPLSRLGAGLLGPFLGAEGRLAFRQLGRRPTRTALTVGVLFLGIAVSIGFGQSLRNNVRDIYRWADRNVGFDFFVRGVMPDTTLLVAAVPLPEGLGDEIAALDCVRRVDKVSFVPTRAAGRAVVALPLTLSAEAALPFALAAGDPEQARQALLGGDVILGTALAQRLGLGVGDTLTLETSHGPRAVRIAGTTSEYTVGGMALYLEWSRGKAWFDMRGVHVFAVTADAGRRDVLGPRLRDFCEQRGLRCQSQEDFRQAVDRAMEGVVGSFWALVVLVFVVASLGVVNTLTMNVLEQTREIGILRAVAMSRSQVRKLVLSQALALGVISLVPGVVAGVALAYLMNLATHPILGQRVAFHLDLPLVVLCFLVALAIAILAALGPARRAVRLPVVEALSYE